MFKKRDNSRRRASRRGLKIDPEKWFGEGVEQSYGWGGKAGEGNGSKVGKDLFPLAFPSAYERGWEKGLGDEKEKRLQVQDVEEWAKQSLSSGSCFGMFN